MDDLPHGSFYHATGGSVSLSFGERLKLIPCETVVGVLLTACSAGAYWVFGK